MRKVKLIIISILKFPSRILSKISPFTIIKNSKLSKKCAILSNTRFYSSSIDDYSYIGRNCYVNSTNIGKFCSIADNCSIGLASHNISWVSTSPVFCEGKNILNKNFSFKKSDNYKITEIGNDVWIGIGVLVISGIKIGDGAIIGAGTIVTKDVDSYSIVVGNPGKVLRYRFTNEQKEALLKSKWWDLSQEKLIEIGQYIDDIDKFIVMLGS